MSYPTNPHPLPPALRRFGPLLLALALAPLLATYAWASEPQDSMTAAHESFLKGDMNKASEFIGKAATSVKHESGKVATSAKDGVVQAGDDLDAFGRSVKRGAVKSDDELKKQFARTDNALAKAWHTTADESIKAGHDGGTALRNAGESVSDAAKWSGTELKRGTQASVNAAKSIGTGVKTTSKETATWLQGVGEAIKDVAHKL